MYSLVISDPYCSRACVDMWYLFVTGPPPPPNIFLGCLGIYPLPINSEWSFQSERNMYCKGAQVSESVQDSKTDLVRSVRSLLHCEFGLHVFHCVKRSISILFCFRPAQVLQLSCFQLGGTWNLQLLLCQVASSSFAVMTSAL